MVIQSPHFIVHDDTDTVGVIVAESVRAGDKLEGWVMHDDSRPSLVVKADIPLGHKVALVAIKSGDTIIKYRHDIGKAIADIAIGEHVHTQNVKTKKW